MGDNYYQETLAMVNRLLDNNEVDKAYWKLKEELEMPYIPRDVEPDLINLFKRATAMRNERNGAHSNSSWTIDQIVAMLQDPFDEEIHLAAFDCLRTMNVRMILPELKCYLLNSVYRNESKTYLLYLLKEQGVDEPISVKKTRGLFQVNPQSLVDYNSDKQVLAIKKLLEDFVYIDNPSLFAICLMVLENYFYALSPEFLINDDYLSLAAAVMFRAHQLQSNPVDLVTIMQLLGGDESAANNYLQLMKVHQVV